MAGDQRFFIRGVAYQPGGAADAQDPLVDTEALAADIEMFKELGINTIRIYTVDNSEDHAEAMRMLDEAGIYLALDASTPKYSLNRESQETLHASYNDDYLNHLFATIDEFGGYSEFSPLLHFMIISNCSSQITFSFSSPVTRSSTPRTTQMLPRTSRPSLVT